MLLCFQLLYTLKNIFCKTLRIKVIKENIQLNEKRLWPLSNLRLHVGNWSWYWRREWRKTGIFICGISIFWEKFNVKDIFVNFSFSCNQKKVVWKKCIWMSWSSFSHSSFLQLCIGSWKSVDDAPVFWLMLSSTGISSTLSFQQCIIGRVLVRSWKGTQQGELTKWTKRIFHIILYLLSHNKKQERGVGAMGKGIEGCIYYWHLPSRATNMCIQVLLPRK